MATTIKIMLNTDRKSVSGLYPLVIRIIHNRSKKMIYSGFKLKEIEFDPVAECALWTPEGSLAKSKVNEINRFILSEKQDLKRLIMRFSKNFADKFSLEELFAARNPHKNDQYVYAYVANEIHLKRAIGKFGTANLYQSTINSLKRFYPKGDLTFKDISYRFLCQYIYSLEITGISTNTIHMYLRNLRSIYNKARKEGILVSRDNPFTEIRMGVLPTVKRALSKETIRRIASLDLSNTPRLDIARDLFMFSFYTRGMSFIDIVLLKKSNILGDAICYSRNKTHQHIQVGITTPLQLLLDKYSNNTVFVLPFIQSEDNATSYSEYRKLLSVVNISLKEIGRILGISTPLTTYVARHSWATIAKQEGAPIAAISEGLGHATEKTTQIYLRAFDRRTIDRINSKIVNLCVNIECIK